MKRWIIPVVVILTGAAWWGYSTFGTDSFKTGNPLQASSGPVELIDAGFSTEALPEGWVHRTFFRIEPTDYRMIDDDGRRALSCTTDNSGSILAREMSIQIEELPILSWNWKIIKPIESSVDEDTKDGDDHPARFFLRFINDSGETKATEIIWSNQKYSPGEYKIMGNFYHLVANGLNSNVGQWHSETVDLRELYKDIGGAGKPVLNVLGFFCDSDNTGAGSAALFSDVLLSGPTP